MRFVLRAAISAALLLAVAGAVEQQCPEFKPGVKVGILKSDEIDEASGIVASRKNKGVLWVHNDHGDSARIFAISAEGSLLGIYNITGVDARDWEDIAIGPGPETNEDYLYIGEIGDNRSRYKSVAVYRVPEPMVDFQGEPVNINIGPATAIRLRYPDGPRDAETLMVDPAGADIYIISKRENLSKVYRAAYPQSTTKTTTMEMVATLPWGWAVGGDISPSGNLVIVRSYYQAAVWVRPDGAKLWKAFDNPECTVELMAERQGEAICFDADGCGYFTVSESLRQPIYYFARKGRCPAEAVIKSD